MPSETDTENKSHIFKSNWRGMDMTWNDTGTVTDHSRAHGQQCADLGPVVAPKGVLVNGGLYWRQATNEYNYDG